MNMATSHHINHQPAATCQIPQNPATEHNSVHQDTHNHIPVYARVYEHTVHCTCVLLFTAGHTSSSMNSLDSDLNRTCENTYILTEMQIFDERWTIGSTLLNRFAGPWQNKKKLLELQWNEMEIETSTSKFVSNPGFVANAKFSMSCQSSRRRKMRGFTKSSGSQVQHT